MKNNTIMCVTYIHVKTFLMPLIFLLYHHPSIVTRVHICTYTHTRLGCSIRICVSNFVCMFSRIYHTLFCIIVHFSLVNKIKMNDTTGKQKAWCNLCNSRFICMCACVCVCVTLWILCENDFTFVGMMCHVCEGKSISSGRAFVKEWKFCWLYQLRHKVNFNETV